MTNLSIKLVMIEKNSRSMHREYHEFYAVHIYLRSILISLVERAFLCHADFFSHFSIVVYEGGSVMQQARSLWRLEMARVKWSGGYINWYHPMRLRHITTGLYLGINENTDLCLLTQ